MNKEVDTKHAQTEVISNYHRRARENNRQGTSTVVGDEVIQVI